MDANTERARGQILHARLSIVDAGYALSRAQRRIVASQDLIRRLRDEYPELREAFDKDGNPIDARSDEDAAPLYRERWP